MIHISVAVHETDKGWLIGKGDKLPWRLKEEFNHFRKLTLNRPVSMGRKTWDGLPFKPLRERQNIVLTRQRHAIKGAYVFHDLKKALAFAKSLHQEIFVIGGRDIFQQMLNRGMIDRMVVSKVRGEYEGDVYFPEFDLTEWDLTDGNANRLSHHADFTVYEYLRKGLPYGLA
jgi:dihydrofolate reductase